MDDIKYWTERIAEEVAMTDKIRSALDMSVHPLTIEEMYTVRTALTSISIYSNHLTNAVNANKNQKKRLFRK